MKYVMMVLFALAFASPVLAKEDPFKHCASAAGAASQLNCQIEVVDTYLKTEFGQNAVNEATKLAKQECSGVAGSVRLDPELRLLGSLQCQLNSKLAYYNKLAGHSN